MPIMIIRPVLILNEVVTRTDKAQIRRQTHKFFRTVKKGIEHKKGITICSEK